GSARREAREEEATVEPASTVAGSADPGAEASARKEGDRGGTRGSPALVAEGVRVHYEGIRAVDGVDLTLERGQIMGLIGPTGAGKTTCMNAVSSFVPLAGGRVPMEGLDVTGGSPQKLVAKGLVRTFQDVATFPGLTVFENVELGALGGGLNRREA